MVTLKDGDLFVLIFLLLEFDPFLVLSSPFSPGGPLRQILNINLTQGKSEIKSRILGGSKLLG